MVLQAMEKKRDQKGSIIIPVLMVLALVSIIGLTASSTTTTELQIVRNKILYKQNLYLAEAAVIAAAQMLEVTPTDQLKSGGVNGIYEDVDMRINDNWADHSVVSFDSNGDGETEQSLVLARGETDTLRTSIVYLGVVKGSSLSLATATSMNHLYAIYGRYSSPGYCQAMIEMRYKRKF